MEIRRDGKDVLVSIENSRFGSKERYSTFVEPGETGAELREFADFINSAAEFLEKEQASLISPVEEWLHDVSGFEDDIPPYVLSGLENIAIALVDKGFTLPEVYTRDKWGDVDDDPWI